ncbi:MAG TPA: glycoside hydrolase family 57 protein [Burkholderiales bacterium]|nr:glycoside hydrolase family 57 protein [Burkholderiales bacterium]
MPSGAPPLTLVLLWHMHQPDYRDYSTGEFREPWTYLHALKDYSDMAWHLEHHAGVRAVVNLTPVLLDQLEDYASQFAGNELRDPHLRLLAHRDDAPLSESERDHIATHCLGADDGSIVQPSRAYRQLHEVFALLESHGGGSRYYLSDQYFYDLLTWHHLRWTGETVRRSSPIVTRLMAIGMRFSYADRMDLFKLVGEVVSGIVPRYRALGASGRIELSSTPHHHPLAPLLMRLDAAREANPALVLPPSLYPGGYGRVGAQLDSALESHRARFGAAPAGIWPAEGAVSAEFVELLTARGCKWTASSSRVLANSLGTTDRAAPYRSYRLAGGKDIALFFRDDRLSDLIGFEYGRWNSHDAAANFVAQLEAIARVAAAEPLIVSAALDGENCWDSYAYNGYYFLAALYEALESHPAIRTSTYGAWLAQPAAPPRTLERLISGSWVNGDFCTWIGSPEKNHAWDLLCSAKQEFDLVMASGRLTESARRAALRQLAACEASDWLWWPGAHNPQRTVAIFDQMYRDNLANLYRLLELPVPGALALPVSHGAGRPEAGGTMRRAETMS